MASLDNRSFVELSRRHPLAEALVELRRGLGAVEQLLVGNGAGGLEVVEEAHDLVFGRQSLDDDLDELARLIDGPAGGHITF